jgi:hypothetical protein
MELAIVIVVVVCILAYYGFMRSVETGSRMANAEVEHLADVHEVSLITRTARLDSKISDETIAQASAVQAKLKAMRNPENVVH